MRNDVAKTGKVHEGKPTAIRERRATSKAASLVDEQTLFFPSLDNALTAAALEIAIELFGFTEQ